jgi:hypothetical protein
LACGIAPIVWALLRKEEKTAKLLEFSIKSLVISYVITSVIWFVSYGVVSHWQYAYFSLSGFIHAMFYIIVPRSLLPVAISIIIYGIFRARLRSWEILLSSWYMFIYAVSAAYNVWWTLFIQPYLHDFYYSGAGALALDMLLALLAFLVAGVFTFAYMELKEQEEEPPP